ncbi:hypothetical protein QVD17_31262 [Tagetes erecta]|uniref:Leucine-rich repeat-containing N-terminal plant-type domain-containing protein n=1 Tax=Tagetes erecta TaxID=13708 RepID=A0AAD8K9F0_TARER|nr:hypothetical protein QVD17_31262 [Tagetes erecta]
MEDWLGNYKSWLLIYMIMLPYFMIPGIQAVCVEEERDALLAFKASLNNSYTYDADPLLPTWVVHGECCEWERVKCDTAGHVTELSLHNVISVVYEDYDRIWPLNISLFLHFKELTSLDLSWNYIDNTIVNTGLERLSSLKKLERLDLRSNSIENGVFPSLSALTSLKYLDIGDNELEGNFPAHELAALVNLEELHLRYCDYYGSFQVEGSNYKRVSGLKKLKILDVEYNQFNESLIASLRSFPSLKAIYLGANNLYGPFPAQELSHLTNLEKLDLKFNGFNGTPSIEGCKLLMRLKGLESVSLLGNKFNKSIISCLRFLPSLKILDLSSNKELGTSFPMQELSFLRDLNALELRNCGLQSLTLNGTMSNLMHLNLDKNNFNNEIMSSMVAFPSLKYLSLKYSFEGGIPFANNSKLPILQDLKVLNLSGNNFNGTLPMEALTSFHRLEVLDLSSNNFVGSIPSTIKLLSSLEAVSFAKNMLHGSLPGHGFCDLKNLHELDLSENAFDGTLHECFSTLSSLMLFDISSNRFTGNVLPSLIANLTSLVYLDFSHNKFEGSFSFSLVSNHTKLEFVEFISDNDKFEVETEEPIGWTPMFQLKVLVLSNCNVNRKKASVFPSFLVNQNKLQVLDMSHNSIQGGFPNWLIKNNTMLELVNLRNNSIDSNFHMPNYRNPNLWWLDLSGNHMTGIIPTDIKTLIPYITHCNLSRNSLDGAISSLLGDGYVQLEALDLSHNQLSGEVPTGMFTNFSQLSVLDLSNNKLHGEVLSKNLSFGSIERLHLDGNRFTGKFEYGVSNMSTWSSLRHLDISNNLFTGLLPS